MANNNAIQILIDVETANSIQQIRTLQRQLAQLGSTHSSNSSTRAAQQQARIAEYTQINSSVKSLMISAQRLAVIYLSFRLPQEFLSNLIDMEKGFIAINKTVDMSVEDFAKLEKSILDLSSEMAGISTEEILDIAAAAGQLGIRGVENITQFTETIAKMAATTDMSAEEAAKAMARLGTIMNEPISQIENMASAINELSNDSTSSAGEIVEISQRMSGMAETFGLATHEVFGFSATLRDVGVSAEVAGTAMNQLMGRMLDTSRWSAFAEVMGVTLSEFAKLIQDDASGALEQFLGELGKLDKVGAAETLKAVGLEGMRVVDTVLKLGNAQEKLNKNMATSKKGLEEGTSTSKEYAKITEGLGAQLTNLWSNLKKVSYEVGVKINPAFKNITQSTIEWMKSLDTTKIAETAKEIGELAVSIKDLVVIFVKVAVATKGLSLLLTTVGRFAPLFAILSRSIGRLRAGFGLFAVATAAVKSAFSGLAAAISINPLLLGFAAVVGLTVYAIESWTQAILDQIKGQKSLQETTQKSIDMLFAHKEILDQQGRVVFSTAEAFNEYKKALNEQILAGEKQIALWRNEDPKKYADDIYNLEQATNRLKDISVSLVDVTAEQSVAWFESAEVAKKAEAEKQEALRKTRGEAKKYTDEELKNMRGASQRKITEAKSTSKALIKINKELSKQIQDEAEELANRLQEIDNDRVSSASDILAKIREIERLGMTEKEQYYDKQKEAEEKLSLAREALAKNNMEMYTKYAAEYTALITANAGHAITEDGKIVISAKKTTENGINGLHILQAENEKYYAALATMAQAESDLKTAQWKLDLAMNKVKLESAKTLMTALQQMMEVTTGKKIDLDFKAIEAAEDAAKEAELAMAELSAKQVKMTVDNTEIDTLETKLDVLSEKKISVKVDTKESIAEVDTLLTTIEDKEITMTVVPDPEALTKFNTAIEDINNNGTDAIITMTPDEEDADSKIKKWITRVEGNGDLSTIVMEINPEWEKAQQEINKWRQSEANKPIYVPVIPVPSGGSSGAKSSSPNKYAGGGLIAGHDLNGTDDIPIMATAGEFILPTDVVDVLGVDNLYETIKNAKKGLSGYADGGQVSNTSNSTTNSTYNVSIDAKSAMGQNLNFEKALVEIIERGM